MKLIPLLLFLFVQVSGQPFDAPHVKSMYEQYPTYKNNLCPACKIWVNPIFTSIADTLNHYPVVERYVYTNANKLRQEKLTDSLTKAFTSQHKGKPTDARSGMYAEWHAVTGQPNMQAIYTYANKQSKEEIAMGHVCAWIWCAHSYMGMLFSDTWDFNCALEYQGQNIGTEAALERYIIGLALKYDTVLTYGGCFAGFSPKKFTVNAITAVMPQAYWKVAIYNGKTECWFMPNQPTETGDKLSKCAKTLPELILIIGFDPTEVLK